MSHIDPFLLKLLLVWVLSQQQRAHQNASHTAGPGTCAPAPDPPEPGPAAPVHVRSKREKRKMLCLDVPKLAVYSEMRSVGRKLLSLSLRFPAILYYV